MLAFTSTMDALAWVRRTAVGNCSVLYLSFRQEYHATYGKKHRLTYNVVTGYFTESTLEDWGWDKPILSR